MNTHACLQQPMAWWAVGPGLRQRADVVLMYQADDPHVVTVSFASEPDCPEWEISRALLVAGMRGRAGLADVVVYPTLRGDIAVRLSSDDGTQTFQVDRHRLRTFLAATHQMVPFGSETTDWDAVIDRILEEEVAS